ncbi:DUF4391 domain-containing protein [Aliarcobacter skirrowii]|uniref:DUF4391 domain-containing protein n=1 Tax=Aliarcobacter skirrowii TaxID=28200 RepID=UPI000D61E9EC|nr:DUF4391 domain-containing protein [Aliarcobacter skirrowii]PWE20133.1 hypothetical protein DGF29_07230 [Aliarcobacter skirrowii]RJO55580.1 DUF4391 domain-containing protein [Aliarcobacter skirrowii]RJO57535.1 DUF4391 domain-containing protein [Aliarcobacter skirrowii]
MIDIIKYFNFPNSTLIERKLFKKQFLDNFSLTSNEKKILSECVDSITLNNLLNKDSINILPFKNETHNYQEIAVISVEINNQNKSKEIANIILHIPYPVVLILIYKEQIQINISPKRLNISDVSKLVVEEQYFTKWIDFKNLTSIDETFLHSLNINNHSFRNFLAFYESFIDKLISYNASIYSGTFSISKDTKMILENIHKTEAQIIDIKNKIKKETNFNDKVNMNLELKKLNDKLKSLKEDLK